MPKAILWGGFIAGVLDAVDAVVAFGLKGLNPIQVLQYITSALLGPSAFAGGLSTAALGMVLHFFIACVVAAVYVGASRGMAVLKNQPLLFGPLYGLAVYSFMNYLVLPLSAAPQNPFSLAMFLNGVIGHALFVGLPIALYARKVAR